MTTSKHPAEFSDVESAVEAAIEHWGHVHERSLRVTARVSARADGEHWRLGEVRLLDKRVVEAASRPRR